MILAATSIPIQVSASDWGAIAPELVLGATVMLLLLLDVFLHRNRVEIMTGVSLAATGVSALFAGHLWTITSNGAFYHLVTADKFAIFFDFIILVSLVLGLLLSPSYIRTSAFDTGEYYALLLASAVGMMLMAASQSLMVIFLALEILSLALYILAGFDRERPRSQESGFKYFLLSSFATAFLIYGMAMIYGATGTTQLQLINYCLNGLGCGSAAVGSPLVYVGIALMVVGFAFKVSIVPFHMWTPDVYEGAPTPVTAFMSVTTKAAVFAAFIRVFNYALSAAEPRWYPLLWALAIATMVVGNVIALSQTNMKRLLAYSGIAHAGYVLVAMTANNTEGITAVAFYFLVYAFMNIGGFVLISVLESNGEVGDQIADYRGLWHRNPVLAGFMAVYLFSLAGFPPTAGFFAKYLAFAAAVKAGHTDLVIVGVLASLVSIFYYLRVVAIMFMQRATDQAKETTVPAAADIVASLAAAGVIGLGIIPTGFLNLAGQSVDALRAAFGLP